MQPGHFVPSDRMPDPSHSFWVDDLNHYVCAVDKAS